MLCAATDKVWKILVAGAIDIACISNGKDPETNET
jgi:hypothetical protein